MDKLRETQQEEQFVSPYLMLPHRSVEEVLRARKPMFAPARAGGREPEGPGAEVA